MDPELEALRLSCSRAIGSHGVRSSADLLAMIPGDTAIDMYGDGGVVTELEQEVAALLGKPAAVFLPSGTMAQQIVLRVHADGRGSRTVLLHPTSHVDMHEDKGYERLHGLTGRLVGNPYRPITLDDLETVAEPFAALLLELPYRELGGIQPSWDDLVAQTTWARSRGAAVHLDGARIWESAAGYGVHPAEIAALFDSAYVSFYKGLGGIAGCVLVGEAAVVAQGDGVASPARRHVVRPLALRRLGVDRPAYAASAHAALSASMPRPSQRCCGRCRGSPYCRTLRRPR